ncbi:vWA domain-containing protein [Streptomyces sp. NPDC093252]|uniref:vWA domain-containing protein n=1 Tax=Streptomyces sp. NPDC093252 TaxID=3154980 RepID=UPI0034194F19
MRRITTPPRPPHRLSTRRRALRALLLTAAALTLTSTSPTSPTPLTLGAAPAARPLSAARAADPVPQVPWADALRRMGLEQGGDYVVVVDSSGSMASRQDEVRAAVRALLAALGPQDRAALVSFRIPDPDPARSDPDPDPAEAVLPLQRVSDADAALARLPAPGGDTDISAGLDVALDELERSNEVRPATVVLVTDAAQTERTDEAARAWDGLVDRVAALRARRDADGTGQAVRSAVLAWGTTDPVTPFAVGSGGCTATNAIEITGCVFSADETQEVRPEDATGFLRRLPDEVGRLRFESALAEDAGRAREGSAVEAEVGEARVTDGDLLRVPVTFTSRTRHLPLWLHDFAFTDPRDPDRTPLTPVRGPDHVELDPEDGGGTDGPSTATAVFHLPWTRDADLAADTPWYAFTADGYREDLRLAWTTGSPYAEQMSLARDPAARFEPAAGQTAFTVVRDSTRQTALPLLVAALLALLLLLWLAGVPTTLWITGPDHRPYRVRVWSPRSHRTLRRAPYGGLTITTAWPRRRPRSEPGAPGPSSESSESGGRLKVVVWPSGVSDTAPSHTHWPSRRGAARRLHGVGTTAYLSRGGVFRPRRAARTAAEPRTAAESRTDPRGR